MKFVLHVMTVFASFAVMAAAPPKDSFYLQRADNPSYWNYESEFDEIPDQLAHDIHIIGPARADGANVIYATLQSPTKAKVKAALDAAREKLASEGKLPAGGFEALDEVNAARARRGLNPFVRDDQLTVAAANAAKWRAERLVAGHCPNDFAHLPSGAAADAAGCAAWPPELGWGSCCAYENWTYAGAAYAIGADGKRYMHLFVRN